MIKQSVIIWCALFGIVGVANGGNEMAIFAVATTCQQQFSPQLVATLNCLHKTGEGLFSVLIMCYDVVLKSGGSKTVPTQGSLARYCYEKNFDLHQIEHCVLTDTIPQLRLTIASTQPFTTKIFKPNPRGNATISASKVHLWKHHLSPQKLSPQLRKIFAW
jgi:hypothetical protein